MTSRAIRSRAAILPTLLTRSIPRTATQMAAYGACIQLNMPDVGKGACQREMEALKACVFAKK